jgi:carbon-monoxide dehydrogenase small subunit
MIISFRVNKVYKELDVQVNETLLEVLRRIGIKSVKCGCNEGNCGVCAAIMDGKLVNTCMIFAPRAHDSEIITAEGLGTPSNPHPIQRAFVEAGAVQCGFCTPAFVLATYTLLQKHPDPDDAQIRTALDGIICRCTGHIKIFEAVKLASKLLKDKRECVPI